MEKRNRKLFVMLAALLVLLLVTVASSADGTLDLPEELEIIETQAFYGLEDVFSVYVPDGVRTIGNEAFGGSDSLQVVSVPSGLLEDPEDTDEIAALAARILADSPNAHILVRREMDIDDFEWVIDGNHAVLTGYSGEAATVNIPQTLGGYPVTVIGPSCFIQNNVIEAVAIPEGVTTIGAEAFKFCPKLKTIILPDSLSEIGGTAFWNCGYLDGESFAIALPDHIATIGSGAFDTDFNSCTGKPKTHSVYGVPVCNLGTDTAAALMNADLEFSLGHEFTLRYGKGTTTGGTTGVFLRSFGGPKALLESIAIPNGVIGICDNVFSGCTKLAEFNLPDTLIKIGAKSFAQCGNDSENTVYFPVPQSLVEVDHGTYSWSFYGCTKIMYECAVGTPLMIQEANEFVVPGNHDCVLRYTSFYNKADRKTYEGLLSLADYCGTATTVTIPEGVEFIDDYAFSSRDHGHADGVNTTVTSVTFPSTLIGFDDYALACCRNLTAVTIPEQVTYIHPHVFDGCYMLSEVNFHNGVTVIGSCAFKECGKDVGRTFYYILPDSLSSTETFDDPFYNCPAVLVTEPNTVTAEWIKKYGITFALPNQYDYRFQFKDVSGTKRIYLTQYLGGAEADIPAVIYAIDGGVFQGKETLTKVVVPQGTVVIGQNAFKDCPNLTDITLPESLTTINNNAFTGSGTNYTGAYAIHLPNSLSNSIVEYGKGSSPFYNCSALLECTRDSDTAHMMSKDKGYSITFPGEHDFLYRYHYANNEYRLYLYRYIGNSTEVVIPECYGISTPNPPSSHREGSYAFDGITTVTSVTVSAGTVVIGDSAFYGCTNLTEVNLPDSITELKNYAFANCGSASSERFYYLLRLPTLKIGIEP